MKFSAVNFKSIGALPRRHLKRLGLSAVLGTILLSGHVQLAKAEKAAGIDYSFVSRPAGLSNDFTPPDEVALRFLNITAIDNSSIDGALWQPTSKPVTETTIVIMIHGSGSSFRKLPQSALGGRLAAAGYAALAIDTRQHDEKINTDNFYDVRKDIEAAVLTAKALGYRKIVVQGHSLGNIQVQFYAATNWDQDIKAVILLGAFGNLPWKTRTMLVQDEDKFRQLAGEALASLHEKTADHFLPSKMPYFSGQVAGVTAQHFLTYRWDKTSAADGTYWIRRIPLPVLILRDQADSVVQPFESYMLLDAAHTDGSLVQRVDYVLLPDSRSPSEKGHFFEGNEQPLADAVVKWLRDLNL
ncbi:MAG: alpha/beta hydrolase [Methylocella sp.]